MCTQIHGDGEPAASAITFILAALLEEPSVFSLLPAAYFSQRPIFFFLSSPSRLTIPPTHSGGRHLDPTEARFAG